MRVGSQSKAYGNTTSYPSCLDLSARYDNITDRYTNYRYKAGQYVTASNTQQSMYTR